MEDMVSPEFWRGRRVMVTGHTGFKGAWLTQWLLGLGAEVSGLALEPATVPNLYELLKLGARVPTTFADINDRDAVAGHLNRHRPETVFHLAAQALVRLSYEAPVDTFLTNVVGVATLLDVVRRSSDVTDVVIATSDKCYENLERDRGYREDERMGGHDPYSASKGCAELAVTSMRRSFFAPYAKGGHPARIATVRAGNVIGGGDWSADRLVPDIVRGCLAADGAVRLRNPASIRPWQHVLEPLRGYLMLAERLAAGGSGFDEGWNFGPAASDERPVAEVAGALVAALGRGRIVVESDLAAAHEARVLRLDTAKARARLGWTPMLGFHDAIATTARWYSGWHGGVDALALTMRQIEDYEGAIRSFGAAQPVLAQLGELP